MRNINENPIDHVLDIFQVALPLIDGFLSVAANCDDSSEDVEMVELIRWRKL